MIEPWMVFVWIIGAMLALGAGCVGLKKSFNVYLIDYLIMFVLCALIWPFVLGAEWRESR